MYLYIDIYIYIQCIYIYIYIYLYWVDLLKKKGNNTVCMLDHNQLDAHLESRARATPIIAQHNTHINTHMLYIVAIVVDSTHVGSASRAWQHS